MKHSKVLVTSLFVVSMFALAGCGSLADCFCCDPCAKPKCNTCCPKPVCKPCVEKKEKPQGCSQDKCCKKNRCCPPTPCESKSMPSSNGTKSNGSK